LLARKKPIGTIQWLSVILVISSGAATLLTNDARFVMAKPSVIYVIVGAVMLKPGWMNRYMPPIALATVPDIVYAFGFIWAGLMFASAALNVVLVLTLDATTWSAVISVYGIVSKLALFLIQYAAMNVIGRRRAREAAPA
jgi:intracellular septation protein A